VSEKIETGTAGVARRRWPSTGRRWSPERMLRRPSALWTTRRCRHADKRHQRLRPQSQQNPRRSRTRSGWPIDAAQVVAARGADRLRGLIRRRRCGTLITRVDASVLPAGPGGRGHRDFLTRMSKGGGSIGPY
jgi:hypothetical protein